MPAWLDRYNEGVAHEHGRRTETAVVLERIESSISSCRSSILAEDGLAAIGACLAVEEAETLEQGHQTVVMRVDLDVDPVVSFAGCVVENRLQQEFSPLRSFRTVGDCEGGDLEHRSANPVRLVGLGLQDRHGIEAGLSVYCEAVAVPPASPLEPSVESAVTGSKGLEEWI